MGCFGSYCANHGSLFYLMLFFLKFLGVLIVSHTTWLICLVLQMCSKFGGKCCLPPFVIHLFSINKWICVSNKKEEGKNQHAYPNIYIESCRKLYFLHLKLARTVEIITSQTYRECTFRKRYNSHSVVYPNIEPENALHQITHQWVISKKVPR